MIARCLATNATLITLDLSENNVGERFDLSTGKTQLIWEGADALGDALKLNTAMCTVNVDGFPLPIKQLKGTDPLPWVDLSGHSLRFASRVIISKLLQVNHRTEWVSISNQGMQLRMPVEQISQGVPAEDLLATCAQTREYSDGLRKLIPLQRL